MKWEDWAPAGKWVIVQADPRVKKTKGGIVLTEELWGVERVMEGTGRILKVGPDVAKAVGSNEVQPGIRIFYRGFLKDVFAEFDRVDDCQVFLLRAEDIMGILDDETQMGEFS